MRALERPSRRNWIRASRNEAVAADRSSRSAVVMRRAVGVRWRKSYKITKHEVFAKSLPAYTLRADSPSLSASSVTDPFPPRAELDAPPDVVSIARRLQDAGFETWAVG